VTEVRLGLLTVLALFKSDPASQIVGGKVSEGKLVNQKKVRVLRAGNAVATATIAQLQKDKQNAGEVAAGFECGLKLAGTNLVQVGDTLECFEEKVVTATLELPRS
jgi:translation initiation factor IF-2